VILGGAAAGVERPRLRQRCQSNLAIIVPSGRRRPRHGVARQSWRRPPAGGSAFLSLCGPLQVISCVIRTWPALRYQRPFDPSALSEPVLRMLCTTDHTYRPASGFKSTVFAPHATAMTAIKEGADYGSDQTQHTGIGRRRDGDRRSAASVCSAGWARSWRAFLRERPRFYERGPVRIHFEEAGSGFPLLIIAGGGLNSTISALARGPFNAIEEFK